MKIMKGHYALFSCNQWKNTDSMRLKGVFTHAGLLKTIKKGIKERDFEFDADVKKMKDIDVYEINTLLRYGYIETVKINEEI